MRRTARSYGRRGPVREPYDYVLIVCEGTKTEPRYLQRLCTVHRLSSANIEFARAGATDPIGLVKFTEQRLQEGGFDRAFCVFDRDGHSSFEEALAMVRALESGRDGRLRAVTSVPCFEVWVLLHFGYTSAAYTAVGTQSSCDRVIRALKTYQPLYAKGGDVFDDLADKMEIAISNAERLRIHNHETGSNNPSTQVDELVEYLRRLNAQPGQ